MREQKITWDVIATYFGVSRRELQRWRDSEGFEDPALLAKREKDNLTATTLNTMRNAHFKFCEIAKVAGVNNCDITRLKNKIGFVDPMNR
jgi:hypothetical protein